MNIVHHLGSLQLSVSAKRYAKLSVYPNFHRKKAHGTHIPVKNNITSHAENGSSIKIIVK